jgi:hypothetical protein
MATKGNIIVEGALAFADLFTMGGAPGFPQKFSATIQIAKGSQSEKDIFEEIKSVCQATWPTEWESKLAAVHSDIQTGVGPSDSKISLQDGDQNQPQYNAGSWVIKPTRRENQGPPSVFTVDGAQVHGVTEPGCPVPGWGVSALINIWAMKTQNRVNFTVIAVRGVQPGKKIAGPAPAVVAAETAAFLAAPVSAQIPGVVGTAPQVAPGATIVAPPVAAIPQAQVVPTAPPAGPPASDLGLEEEGPLIEL